MENLLDASIHKVFTVSTKFPYYTTQRVFQWWQSMMQQQLQPAAVAKITQFFVHRKFANINLL